MVKATSLSSAQIKDVLWLVTELKGSAGSVILDLVGVASSYCLEGKSGFRKGRLCAGVPKIVCITYTQYHKPGTTLTYVQYII